jgi:hypothetical protein
MLKYVKSWWLVKGTVSFSGYLTYFIIFIIKFLFRYIHYAIFHY